MTSPLFLQDSYLKTCSATVAEIDERGIQFDQTIFYATGGGQPGDSGFVKLHDGTQIPVTTTVKERQSGEHIHVVDTDNTISMPNVGDVCELAIDWQRRYNLMRMHSCLHMLCALIDAPVTGGSIQDERGRLDFDLAETMEKEKLQSALNALISADHSMSIQWITDEELDNQPELVRTLSVKPPRGSGQIRLVNFEGIDLQPCGGTHVASTAEIGGVRVAKIEKKGRQNRRITIVFDE